MDGEALIKFLIDASGLPAEWAKSRLNSLLEAKGISPKDVSLADLREVLAELMQDALVEAKSEVS